MALNPRTNTAYIDAWGGSFALLLSQLTAENWQHETIPQPADYVPVVGFRISSSQMAGAQKLTFAQSDLGVLLSIFLSEEIKLSAPLDEMQREAAEELIRQWCGLAASALKQDYGELSFQVAVQDGTPESAGDHACLVRASSGARAIAAMFDPGEVSMARVADAKPETSPAPPAPISTGKTPSRIEELLRQGNLELLMDVELQVMLRFGSREVTLREVLDLATGAVLELDREVQEPVDLVLNGKVIARGEVVVIDGNYGLRVSEVASPQQRANLL